MATYHDVDDFIQIVFPLEYQKIIKQSKSKVAKRIEEADAVFDEELEKILKGVQNKPASKL